MKKGRAQGFTVETIAAHLEALEETIIGRLIDRAQFRVNRRVYMRGKSGFEGAGSRSLFELRLLYEEKMDARFGRFLVPEERPFNRRLPHPRRSAFIPDTGLHIDDYDVVSQTPLIVERYLSLVKKICLPGDDGHHGSSVEHDVMAVQAIARRIHYGSLYIAESKYRQAPALFDPLIEKGDVQAIISSLTRRDVEERIVRRIAGKTRAAQSRSNPEIRHRLDPDVVASFYRETIVPLTKVGEARYLLNRCEGINRVP